MRLITIGLVAVSVIACSVTLAAPKPGGHAGDRSPDLVYAQSCGYCHGRNVGPVIRGRKLPAEVVKMIVRHGQNGMPAFRPTEISPAELDAVARWVSASKADPKERSE